MVTIAIDFDGTIVQDVYPGIGKFKRGAIDSINELYDAGHTIIINTCRVGVPACSALKALIDNNVKFDFFNENSISLINKFQGDCRKISADIYIDNKNLSETIINWDDIMMRINKHLHSRPIIFCVVGKSGSGKTAIVDYIEEEYNIKMIRSYTDRAKRFDGENCHTFLSVGAYDKLDPNYMIASTKFGDHRYCCLKYDVGALNTYVIDEHGLKMLNENHSDEYDIVSIKVERPDELNMVSDERKLRDVGKFVGGEYDYVINNTYKTLDELYDDVDKLLLNYFKGV